jgi:hypothetical protein
MSPGDGKDNNVWVHLLCHWRSRNRSRIAPEQREELVVVEKTPNDEPQ